MNLIYPEKRTVVVNTKTERAFKGILWKKRLRYLVLRNSVLLKTDGSSVVVDGEVLIMADNVDFIQVV